MNADAYKAISMPDTDQDTTYFIPLNLTETKAGAPTDYTPDTANIICQHIAEGQSLRRIAEHEPLAPSFRSIITWLLKHEEFALQYAHARTMQADVMVDDITHIADHGEDVRRDALRIDARKWVASKLKPKKYGDHKQLEISGGIDLNVSPIHKVLPAGANRPALTEDKRKRIASK